MSADKRMRSCLLCGLTAGLLLALLYRPMRVVGILTAGLCLFALTVRRLRKKSGRAARRALRVLWCLFVCGVLLLSVTEGYILSQSRTDAVSEPDAVIILGAGVNGRTPSLCLKVRLDAALAYLADKPAVPVVVTGGLGEGEEITEAACMAEYLSAHGIAPTRILREEKALNTGENLAFSLALLREEGFDAEGRIAVVTSDYHLARAKALFGGDGFIPVAAPMPAVYFPLTCNYYLREAFGLLRVILLHR